MVVGSSNAKAGFIRFAAFDGDAVPVEGVGPISGSIHIFVIFYVHY